MVLLVAGTTPTRAQSDIDGLRTRAQQGDATAQFNLARLYVTGTGAPLTEHGTDTDAEAVRWYRLAARGRRG